MQPRPQIPFRGGGMRPPMMNPMMGRGNMNPMMGRGMSPMMGMGGPQGKQGGGLLAKLLGKGKQSGGIQALGNAASRSAVAAGSNAGTGAGAGGGILKALSNPNSINGFLANTQKVLNTAQQFGPMVQQYGPMVRNLPAMWKLYKGLKDAPSETEEASTDSSPNNEESTEIRPKRKKRKQTTSISPTLSEKLETPKASKSAKGSSVPKMYI